MHVQNHVSPFALLLFTLNEFSFPAKSALEGLLQEPEQFLRGPEIQPLAGINLFRRPFEPTSCGLRSGAEPYDKSASHIRQDRMFNMRGAFGVWLGPGTEPARGRAVRQKRLAY